MASPRDFLDEDYKPDFKASNPRDFLDEQPQESFGEAAKYALPRLGEDIYKAGYQGIQNIPEYWEKAKTEVPAFLNPMNFLRHPIERGKQSLAGLLELAQGINHAPRNIAQYAANRLHLLPQEWAEKIPQAPSLDEDIEKYIGQPKNSGDALSRGLARNADLLMGGNALLKTIPHLTKRGASKTLKKARGLAEERNIGTLNINPELVEDARQFLPNTLPHRNALEAAHYGDYDTLFKLQSDVGKNASDYAKSLFSAAERSHGKAGLQARNRLLDAIHENLQSQGHHDISDLLRKGQNEYRKYIKFRPYRNILGVTALGMALPKNSLIDLGKKILSHKTQ